MHLDRMLALMQATDEAPDELFDMREFGHPCGTPACFLGNYAAREDLQDTFLLIQDEPGSRPRPILKDGIGKRIWPASPEIAEHFGITQEEAFECFEYHGAGRAFDNKPAAIHWLRSFIDQHLA